MEYPGGITESDAHVRALAERVAYYARELRADITHAADVEDELVEVRLLAWRLVTARPATAAAIPVAPSAATVTELALPFQVPVVGGLDVRDVEETVAADAEIDESRLDARLDVDDAALVDVADVALVAGPLDVQLLQHPVLENRDPAR